MNNKENCCKKGEIFFIFELDRMEKWCKLNAVSLKEGMVD